MDAKSALTSSLSFRSNRQCRFLPRWSRSPRTIIVESLRLFFPSDRQSFWKGEPLRLIRLCHDSRLFSSNELAKRPNPVWCDDEWANLKTASRPPWRCKLQKLKRTLCLPKTSRSCLYSGKVGSTIIYLGRFFVNKQSLRYNPRMRSRRRQRLFWIQIEYAGLEYNCSFQKVTLTGKAMVLQSFGPDNVGSGFCPCSQFEICEWKSHLGTGKHEYVFSESYTAK